MKTFKTARYAPQPKFEIFRSLGVVSVGALVGVACGIAGTLFTAYLFSFPLIFDAIIGVAIALVMVKVNEWAKVRVPILMATGALVAGLFAIGTIHVGEYMSFKSSFDDVPLKDLEYALALKAHDRGEIELPKAVLDARPTDTEKIGQIELLQVESITEYFCLTARQGIELGRPGRAGGMNLGFYGTIAYWAVEGIILISIAVLMVWKESSRPFCESCDQWMSSSTIGEIFADSNRVASLVEEGSFSILELTRPGADKTRLKLFRCHQCASVDESVVRVANVTYYDEKEDENRVMDFTMSDEAVETLVRSLGHEADSEELQVLESVRDISDDATEVSTSDELTQGTSAKSSRDDEIEACVADLIKSQQGNCDKPFEI